MTNSFARAFFDKFPVCQLRVALEGHEGENVAEKQGESTGKWGCFRSSRLVFPFSVSLFFLHIFLLFVALDVKKSPS
jgi:hypothetical protein